MSCLARRVRKLESQLTDRSGLAPHTPEWLAYWMREIEAVVRGPRPPKRLQPLPPLDAMRAWLRAQPDEREEFL